MTRFAFALALTASAFALAPAADWPQWRGPNRDARATDFKAPAKWPENLTQKWKVAVGDGVGTPALVGDKLFVFTRDGGAEVTRCLKADTGEVVWTEKYTTPFSGKGDQGYQGPRSSPAVADGMVVTFGVNGTLSCLKADSGAKVWRVETGAVPRFHTSSSPVIADKLVVVQIGSENNGGVHAYDLATGEVKWKWTDEGASYASPVLMTVGTAKAVVAETDKSVVALGLADGKSMWKTPFALGGKGPGNYNASTPAVEGETVIVSGSGRGTRALKIEKAATGFTAKELWSNKDSSSNFGSPVVKGGHVYGLTSNDAIFCVNAETGKTAWTHSTAGRRGYGNVLDAGAVMFAQTAGTGAKLLVFEPNPKEYTEVAAYKVSDTEVYAYPIATGNRIYIKDRNSVILWTVE